LVNTGVWQGELSHRHRDGHTINVVSHWVLHRHADLHSVVEVANDITARVATDQRGLYYASIVENSHDAIIGKDLAGIIKSWNPAAEVIFGWRAEDIIGQPIATLIPPEGRAEEEAILARLRRGERLAQFETRRRHRDGHDIWVLLTVSPIRDKDGVIIGASKIARDLSSTFRIFGSGAVHVIAQKISS
jgi:PAS domain S-box-containing protein